MTGFQQEWLPKLEIMCSDFPITFRTEVRKGLKEYRRFGEEALDLERYREILMKFKGMLKKAQALNLKK